MVSRSCRSTAPSGRQTVNMSVDRKSRHPEGLLITTLAVQTHAGQRLERLQIRWHLPAMLLNQNLESR